MNRRNKSLRPAEGKKKSEAERLSENARIGILYAVAAAFEGVRFHLLQQCTGAEGEECNPLTLELPLQPAGSGGVAGTVCGFSYLAPRLRGQSSTNTGDALPKSQ